MEGLNKIISLFLGLIVVVVFLGILTGRINLKGRFPKLAGIQTKLIVNPTPSTGPAPSGKKAGQPKPKITIRVTSESTTQTSQYHQYKKPALTPAQKYYSQKVTSIPSTGAPTLFLPLALSGILGGMFLRKKS
jgi:hypothetical protein